LTVAFLHTAAVHVETFERLACEADRAIAVRHEIRADLLSDVLAAGAITPVIRAAITAAVQALARDGARVIVCTCSTLGGTAEGVSVPDGVRVLRIDRPMAEQAVESGRRIVVVAALRSTFEPTVALLRDAASKAGRSVDVVEVLCERAWPFFEHGDRAAYLSEIALTIERTARATDLVLLAQASMAPAAELVAHLGVPVLSSPRLGVQTAMAMHRAISALPR
jgi:hypothetical protein